MHKLREGGGEGGRPESPVQTGPTHGDNNSSLQPCVFYPTLPFTHFPLFLTFKINASYSEIPSISLSLCFSYRYLCRRASNTDFV